MTSAKQSVYERIGFASVKAAVNLWLTKAKTDPKLSALVPFLLSCKDKQVAIMADVLGTGGSSNADGLWGIHLQGLKEHGCDLEAYSAYIGLFTTTLKDLNVPQDLVDETAAVFKAHAKFFGGEGAVTADSPAPAADTNSEPEAAPSFAPSSAATSTLYDRIGEGKIRALVEAFYMKILSDPVLKPFFVGMDVGKFKFQFLSYVFGDPTKYKGKDMRAVHAPMITDKGLTVAHWELSVKHFVDTLKEGGVSPEDLKEAHARVAATKQFFEPLTEEEKESMKSATLYSKLGETTVKAMVDLLYRKVVADAKLAPFFEGIDITKMRHKQVTFLVSAMGGPATYNGRDLRAVHLPLIKEKGLTIQHFEAFANHLATTVNELKIPKPIAERVNSSMQSFRQYFVPLTNEEKGEPKGSLYDRVGAEAGMKLVADSMYTRLTTDPRLTQFFVGYDVDRLKHKVAVLLTQIFGGPAATVRDLRQVHTNMIKYKGLTQEHFDMFVVHFTHALQDLHVEEDLISSAMEVLMTKKVHFRPLDESELAAVKTAENAHAKAAETVEIDFRTRHFCATC